MSGGFRFFLMGMVTLLSVQVKIAWTQALPINALPSGGQVQSGAALIDITGANMLIHQSTQRAAIDWKSFDVGRDASIHFNQPNSAASTLNRITGADPSQIMGRIRAPGQVFISNGNGVYFGRSASVDVGSLVATTMNIDLEDFMNGQLRFLQGDEFGEVVNEGELRAKFEGFVALLAPEVRNQGLIFAEKGTVALASGEMVELELDPHGKLSGIRVTASEWDALIENKNAIEAEDGLVILSAQAVRSLRGGLIRNTGSIQATGIKKVGGRIVLTAGEDGRIEQAGLLNVSSLHGKGGSIILEGEEIVMEIDSVIDATGSIGGGEVLIGGDWQGGANEELRVFDDPDAIIQAEKIFMAEGARIDASASSRGDGGKVVLWSDVLNPNSFTTVLGEIYAKGGAGLGDGGMVETSGRILNINQAKVSTIATAGSTGLWLLDPGNINITDSGTTDTDSLPSFPVGSDTDIHPTSIVNALGSSNISIQTGSGSYDLTVSSPITYAGSNDLTLEASQDININAAIDVGSGTLTVNADNDITLSADLTTTNTTNSAIILNAGKNDSARTSSGGDVIISGTPTISIGGSGRATFYTGSIAGSTGLTSLIGLGSGNFRYDGDETEAFYSTALSSGKYAIYRERPSANVNASSTSFEDGGTSFEYGGSTPTISSSVLQNGDVLSASIASASYTDHGGGVSYLDVKYSGSHSGDDIAILSYSISENLSGLGYDVTADTITVTPKVVSLSAVKIYDGTNDIVGSELTIGNLIANESIDHTNSTVFNRHVEADESLRYVDNITLRDGTLIDDTAVSTKASNYAEPSLIRTNAPVTTNVATLTVTIDAASSTGLSKSYDGTVSADDSFSPSYTFSGTVDGDSSAELSFKDANYNSVNVADANTLTISGITINNISGSRDSYPTDYVLASTTETVSASINKAVLTVSANSSFKFVGESDPVGFAGVTYSGFMGSEDSSILSGSTTLSRTTTPGDPAGDEALIPNISGLSADNYSFSAVNGTFTIIPVNELLVHVADASTIYGTNSGSYTIDSVTYYDGSSSQTASSTIDGSNQATVSDGTNDIIFTLGPPSGNNSSSGNLNVGTYKLEASVISNNSVFTSTVAVNGTHTVAPLSLTLSQSHVSAGKSKIYDGTPDMEGLQYDLSSLIEGGDTVSVSGIGTYRDSSGDTNKDVEVTDDITVSTITRADGLTIRDFTITDKAYTIENVIMAGTDASNYSLSSNLISGTDGRITQRPIHYLPAEKTYDGSQIMDNDSGINNQLDNSQPVIEGQIIILDHSDDTGDSTTLINNENFSYFLSGDDVGTVLSQHVTGPDDQKETFKLPHETLSGYSDTDNYITRLIMDDDKGGSEFEPQNYSLPTMNVTNLPFKVNPKELYISDSRVYDSTVDWPDSGGEALSVSTGVSGESLQYSSASTATEHAGTTYISAITLQDASDAVRQTSGSYHASGFITDYTFGNQELWDTSDADHTNITISPSNTNYNNITIDQKPITISGITVDDKVYNGLTSSNAQFSGVNSNLDTLGRISGDELEIASVTGVFADEDVSISGSTIQDKTVTLTTGYTGSDLNNYAITDQASAQAKINQRPVSFVGSLVYDGTTTITDAKLTAGGLGAVSGDANSGLVGSETLGFSASFQDKDHDYNNNYISSISFTDGTNGGLADNYKYPSAGVHDGSLNEVTVDQKTVSLSADKVYDGGTALTGSEVTITTGVGSETLTYSGATSNDKDVATSDKYINAITLVNATDGSGGLSANYLPPTLNHANAPVTITVKALSMNGLTSADREYDGTTTADVTGSPGSLLGAISPGSGTDLDEKPYEDTSSVSLTGTAVGTFSDKNVADDKTVTFSGVSLTGSEASNYTLNAHETAKHDITPKPMEISGLTASNRVYDGGTNIYIDASSVVMSGLVTINGVDDDVNIASGWNGHGSIVDENVGNGKTVTITSTYTGNDVGNYSITDQAPTTVNITQRPVGLLASKIYDGTTSLGAGTITIDTGVSSDDLDYSSATASSMDVSGNKYVDSITLVDGSTGLASNFTTPDLTTYDAADNSVTINPKPITISGLSSIDHIYDATTTATVNGTAVLQGAISPGSGSDSDGIPYSGDGIALSATTSGEGVTGTFDSMNVGTRTVSFGNITLTGSGSKASNYSLTPHATVDQIISSRGVTLTATKTYDGDNTLGAGEVTVTTGLAESLNFSSATVSDINVATSGKYISTITLEDNGAVLASNYHLPNLDTANAPATINTKTVSLSASKVYDGTTDLSGSVTLSTGVGSETLTYSGAISNNLNVATANKYISAITLADATDGSGGVASNYQLPSLDNANAPVTITRKALTLSGLSSNDKVYDASDDATISSYGSLSGILSPDDVSLNTGSLGADVANFSNEDVAVGGSGNEVVKTVTLTLTDSDLTGSAAGNYSITDQTTNDAKILKKDITLRADDRSKTYGDGLSLGSSAFSVTSGAYASGESVSSVTLAAANSYDSSTTQAVGSYTDEINISSAVGAGGFTTGNYDIVYETGDLTIDRRAIELTATNQSKTYGDSLNLGTSAFTKTSGTYANSESATAVVLTSANSYDSGTSQSAATYTDEISISSATGSGGFLEANYDVTYVQGDLTINQRAITLVADDRSKTYGDSLFLGGSAFSLSSGSFANSESISSVSLDSSSSYDSSTTQGVGAYADEIGISNAVGANGFVTGNYAITYDAGDLTINQRVITLAADDRSKIYGDSLVLGGSAFSLTSGIFANSESVSSISLSASNNYDSSTTQGVGTYADEIAISSAVGTGGFITGNYAITYDPGNLTISQRPITLVANDQSKTYGDALSLGTTGFTKSSGTYANSELATAVSLTSANSYDSSTSQNAGTYSNEISIASATGSGGFSESNYDITYTGADLTINPRPIELTAGNRARTYGSSLVLGNTDFTLTSGSYANSESVSSVNLQAQNSYDSSLTQGAGTYTDEITIGSASGDASGFAATNYAISYTSGDLTINPAALTITADNISKVYGGADPVRTLTYNGFMNGEDDSVIFGLDVTAPTGSSATAGTHAVIPSGATAANYNISFIPGTLSVGKASLVVTANDAAKFLTQSDSAAFEGVSYSGFVYGELASDAGLITGTLAVNRSNTGTELAGIYSDVLIPSGLVASNYDFDYRTGDLTIVGSDQLLVKLNDVSDTYGTPTSYSVSSVEYYDGSSVIRLDDGSVSGSSVSIDASNQINLSDGFGGNASFAVGAVSASLSSSSQLEVGSYSLGSIGLVTENSANFNDTVTVVGSHQVSSKNVTAAATSGLSKVYDSTTTMNGLNLNLIGAETGDSVTVDGHGSYASANVGTGINYTVAEMSLSGIDSSNYHLSGGYTASGSDGVVLAKTISISAAKTYDGNMDLSGYVTLETGVALESLAYTGATTSSEDVAVANKYIDSITLQDATDGSGGLVSNYQLPTLNVANAPVTINAKTVGLSASRIYDGSSGLLGDDVTITTGVGSETLSHSGSSSSSKDVAVSNKYINAITLADATDGSGGLATNYQLPVLDSSNAPVTISAKTVGLTANRIYDGSDELLGADVTITTGVGSESLTFTGATSSSKDVATANKFINAITLTDAIDGSGGLASNYELPSLDAINAPATIQAKPVSLSAVRTYDGSVNLSGAVTIITGVGTETLSYQGATSSSKDVATANKFIDTITLKDASDMSGGLASNYELPTLDASNAPVTINAKTIELFANRTYDGTAHLLGGDVSITTGVGSETLTHTGTASSSKDVATTNKFISAISLTDATDGSGGLASNYQLPSLDAANAPVTITAKTVGLSANRIYDGTFDLLNSDVLITTGVGNETLSHTGTTSSSKDVAVANKFISSITLADATDGSGGISTNYQLPSLDAINAPVTITARTVGLSANRIYDGSLDLLGADVTITTGVGIETLTHTATTSSSKDVAIADKYIESITLLDALDGSGGLVTNYQLPNLDSANAPVSIDAKTVELSAHRIYDGSLELSGDDVTITTGVGIETLAHSGTTSTSKDVLAPNKFINAITLLDASDGSGGLATNYQLPTLDSSLAPVSLSSKLVTLSAEKTYDGNLDLSTAVTVDSGVTGEILSYSNAMGSDKNVDDFEKYIQSITLENSPSDASVLASNYHLPTLNFANSPLTILPASLNITADDETKNYGLLPDLETTAFQSEGLIGNETVGEVLLFSEGALKTAALGTYPIIPSFASGGTFQSSNYAITYSSGTLTVEPSVFEESTALAGIQSIKTNALAIENSGVSGIGNMKLTTMISGGPPPAPSLPSAAPSAILPSSLPGPSAPLPSTAPAPVPGPSSSAAPVPSPGGSPAPGSMSAPNESSAPSASPGPSSSSSSAPAPSASSGPAPSSESGSSSSSPAPSAAAAGSGSSGGGSGGGSSGGSSDSAGSASGNSNGLAVDLLDRPDTSTVGLVAVSVPAESSVSGTGFSFGLPTEVSTMVTEQPTAVDVTLQSGEPLPNWLKFDRSTAKFTSSAVPDGAFPITVMMKIGGQQVAIVISERTN
ncbi:MAG: YDG domain-containing protein [Opitutales bacterium]